MIKQVLSVRPTEISAAFITEEEAELNGLQYSFAAGCSGSFTEERTEYLAEMILAAHDGFVRSVAQRQSPTNDLVPFYGRHLGANHGSLIVITEGNPRTRVLTSIALPLFPNLLEQYSQKSLGEGLVLNNATQGYVRGLIDLFLRDKSNLGISQLLGNFPVHFLQIAMNRDHKLLVEDTSKSSMSGQKIILGAAIASATNNELRRRPTDHEVWNVTGVDNIKEDFFAASIGEVGSEQLIVHSVSDLIEAIGQDRASDALLVANDKELRFESDLKTSRRRLVQTDPEYRIQPLIPINPTNGRFDEFVGNNSMIIYNSLCALLRPDLRLAIPGGIIGFFK
jgi:hypothetical protein